MDICFWMMIAALIGGLVMGYLIAALDREF